MIWPSGSRSSFFGILFDRVLGGGVFRVESGGRCSTHLFGSSPATPRSTSSPCPSSHHLRVIPVFSGRRSSGTRHCVRHDRDRGLSSPSGRTTCTPRCGDARVLLAAHMRSRCPRREDVKLVGTMWRPRSPSSPRCSSRSASSSFLFGAHRVISRARRGLDVNDTSSSSPFPLSDLRDRGVRDVRGLLLLWPKWTGGCWTSARQGALLAALRGFPHHLPVPHGWRRGHAARYPTTCRGRFLVPEPVSRSVPG